MSALPHIGQTVRQRQALMTRLAAAPTREQRAALARDFAKRHPESAALRYELERADRHEAQRQADALLRRIRAAGEVGCADPTERPLTLREVFEVNAVGMLLIVAMLAFGYLLRDPVAYVLARMGVLS